MKKIKIFVILITLLLLSTIIPTAGTMKINKFNDIPVKRSLTPIKLHASNGKASDSFGCSIDIDGDYIIVGAIIATGNTQNSGAAYIFHKSGGIWVEEQILKASDGADQDYFGSGVAIDGEYAVVGADCDDDKGDCSGSAYVFKRTGSSWTEVDKLIAPDGVPEAFFGRSVTIEGNYILVGADGDDEHGEYAGAAYLYKLTGSNWIWQAKLVSSIPAAGDGFGWSVDFNAGTAIIGSYRSDYNGISCGLTFIYTQLGDIWIIQDILNANDADWQDDFGIDVSIDGDYAAIGAHLDDDKGRMSGSAYIFKRTGTSWSQETKLLASDGEIQDYFGVSVSLDGDNLLITADADYDGGSGAGSAYVFKKVGSTWVQQGKLVPNDLGHSARFGRSSAIEGEIAVIGAYHDDDLGMWSGSAYVYNINDANQPPSKPSTPSGPTSGNPGNSYTYYTSATEPEGELLYYWFDWGDNTNSGWLGPFNSGDICSASKTWSFWDDYHVRVKVKDASDIGDIWSDPLIVTMPKYKEINNSINSLISYYLYMFPVLQRFLDF